MVSTIKQVLGLSVNHVMVITFGRFKRAVDQMGCVYSTIDRRYYQINTPTSEQYQEINLQPGYQGDATDPVGGRVSGKRHAGESGDGP